MIRVSLTAFFVRSASVAGADVCVAIDESRDTFASRDRAAAILLVTTQFESGRGARRAKRLREIVRAVSRSAGRPRRRDDVGSGKNLAGDRADTEDLPAIYSQVVRSIVTGRPMTGLNVIDRTNVASSQAESRRVHTDTMWYGRLGYGGVFADRTYGSPAIGPAIARARSFAIDVAFLNHQFASLAVTPRRGRPRPRG